MKKNNNKPNPLKFFNDNNAKARMKAGGAMKEFKKSLPKAQDGYEINTDVQGPMQEGQQKSYNKRYSDAINAQKANIVYGPKGSFDSAYDTDMGDLNYLGSMYRSVDKKERKKGGPVKNTPPKAQKGISVKTYKNTPYSKETIVSKTPKGKLIYEADKTGKVSSINPQSGTMVSIDTTGYSKGKSSFPKETTGKGGYQSVGKIARSSVLSAINNMKKEVNAYKKKGGAIKSKRK